MSFRSRLAVPLMMLITACVTSASGCAGNKPAEKGSSARALWVDSPTSGSSQGDEIIIPGLQVSFVVPDTLYVYRSCKEATHRAEGKNAWIPVIRCESDNYDAERDEYSEGASGDSKVLTIYAAHKTMVINERMVETMRAEYQNQGLRVDEIGYHSAYLSKENRSGIESRVLRPGTAGESGRETLRFMFPVGDVVFVAHIDYPPGTDRSGMNQDWRRIIWNFQLDEDGPLYPE